MKKLIFIAFVLGCFGFGKATNSRIKRDTWTEDNLQSAITEIQEVGRAVSELTTMLETKVDEIKTEFWSELDLVKTELALLRNEIKMESRVEMDELKSEFSKEIQDAKSELQSYLLEIQSELSSKWETIEETITSMLARQDKSDQELEALVIKTDDSIRMISSLMETGESILQQVNTTNPSRIALNSVTSSTTNTKTQLAQILSNADEFKNQVVTSSQKMTGNANGIVQEINSFLGTMATAQLNETLGSLSVFESNTVTPIPEFWPFLKVTNFSPTLLVCALSRFPGLLRDQEWVVIQTRGVPLKAGRTWEPFYNRTWSEYSHGFGSYDADFWFGLDKIHDLSKAGFTELRIELEDWEGNTTFAQYNDFHISDSSDNYRLNISGFSGGAGNSMGPSNGRQFSTVDQDNDSFGRNCALDFGGPWWNGGCSHAYLNYDYQTSSKIPATKGITWWHWKASWEYSLKKVEMKIRRPT